MELNNIAEVRRLLKGVDTMMYEIERDYRVSGLPLDNKHMQEMCKSVSALCAEISRKAASTYKEASKNNVTGV